LPGFARVAVCQCGECYQKSNAVPNRTGQGQRSAGTIGLAATIEPDKEGQRAGAEVVYAELLKSGVTTLVDLSFPYPERIDLAARSGLRLYLAPWYASSSWCVDNRHEVKFRWKADNGYADFQEALRLIDRVELHNSGRLRGMVYPAQIDTCTEDLLQDSFDAARERGCPFSTHIAQSVVEFNLMVSRYGRTPIQWANEIGILAPSTILGHAIFIDEHSWLHWPSRKDLPLLVDSGASVAHCPTPFARYGQLLALPVHCSPGSVVALDTWWSYSYR
jgi:cytosine/adenosine deaminase-related metal-dependent hydrolase